MRRVLLLIQLILASSECHGDCEETAFLQANEDWPHRQGRHRYGPHYDLPTLSESDILQIKTQCHEGVAHVNSSLRTGDPQPKVAMQIVIMPRAKPSEFIGLWDVGAAEDDSSLLGSRDIARAKAFTALGFSSNQNALSSRGIGFLEGVALPGIHNTNRQTNAGVVLFGGGLPLFKNGKLVGAVGVSGDGVVEDEKVALACATTFEPPPELLEGGVPFVEENITNPLATKWWRLEPASSRRESLPVQTSNRSAWPQK